MGIVWVDGDQDHIIDWEAAREQQASPYLWISGRSNDRGGYLLDKFFYGNGPGAIASVPV